MSEIISPISKEHIENIKIFDISKANTIIACIYGEDSSPKLVRNLIDQGNKDFACLSGGIYGLSYHLNDHELILSTNVIGSSHNSENQRKIFNQTKKTPNDYYKCLKDKRLIIITHNNFLNLEETITGENLINKIGVKEIICFREAKNAQTYIRNKFNIQI
ncbi:MAG: hypothetical protein WCG91_02420 [Candidatus Shapirobacteria bacterium]